MVSTLAGTGTAGFMDDTNGMTGSAQFDEPTGVALDSAGNVYVADRQNHRIRKITSGGVVSTLAGTGTMGSMDGTNGMTGSAQFNEPHGVAVDGSGFVYVADTFNHRIRKITSRGVVSTLAGGGTTGTRCPGTTITTVTCRDGTGTLARFNYPVGVAIDSANNVYVADYGNHRIRKITIPQ